MLRKTIIPAATAFGLLTVAASPAFALEAGQAALGLTGIAVGAAAAGMVVAAPVAAVAAIVCAIIAI